MIGHVDLYPEYSHLFCQKFKNTIPENMWEIQFASGRPTGNWFLKRYGATTYPFVQERDQRTNGCSVNQIMYNTRLYFTYGEGDARREWNCSVHAYDYSINDPERGSSRTAQHQRCRSQDRGCASVVAGLHQVPLGSPDLPLNASNGEDDYEYMSSNFPLLRYADVLLMYVEANLKCNGGSPDAEATDLFNSLRARARGFDEDGDPITAAQTPDFPNLPSNIINADTVLNERMRELCFESQRWFDLARTGQLDVRYNKNIDDGMMPPNSHAGQDRRARLSVADSAAADRSFDQQGGLLPESRILIDHVKTTIHENGIQIWRGIRSAGPASDPCRAFLTGCQEDFSPEPEDIELIEYSRPKDRPKDFLFCRRPRPRRSGMSWRWSEDEKGHRSTEDPGDRLAAGPDQPVSALDLHPLQLRQVAAGVVQGERLYRRELYHGDDIIGLLKRYRQYYKGCRGLRPGQKYTVNLASNIAGVWRIG